MPPIGLLFHKHTEELTRAALDNCIITHNEPRARAAAVGVAYLTARLLQSNEHSLPGDQVLETADHIAPMDKDLAAVLRWTTQIVHLPPEKALFEIGTSSDVMEAFPAAVYCFLKHPGKFTGGVLSAVNAGDAADAVGALAGSFIGNLAGVEAIDRRWLAGVENSQVLVGIGERLAEMLCRTEPGTLRA
jgi:ADP-ribosylglycohydrolase